MRKSPIFKEFDEELHREYSYYAMAKWLYYPGRVAKVKKRKFHEVRPVTAQIVPTLHCNFSCPRCSYGRSKEKVISLQHKSLTNMDRSAMFSIIDSLRDAEIKGVVFTGGGEPTLNPYLMDGMCYASQKGIKIGLFTNGSILTPHKISSILDLNPTFLRISLDAGTPLTHSLIHGYDITQGHFQNILKNLESMAKEKVRRNYDTTIGVGVSVEPVNLNNLTEIAIELRRINDKKPEGGIDYLVFRPVVNYRCGGYEQRVAPVLEYLKKNKKQHFQAYWDYIYKGKQLPGDIFEQANKIIDNSVTEILKGSGIDVINIRTKMLGVTKKNRPFSKCRACPWYIFIGPDATVYNCVELGLIPRVGIGNLLTQSLSEIWESPLRKDVLDYIDSEGLQKLCPPICLYYEMNELFEKLDKELSKNSSGAYKWIEEQENGISLEKSNGLLSQKHIEFI